MSEKITRPDGPSRSSAPNAMRPSPVPTSSSVSPGRSRARSSTASRTGYRNSVRSFSRRAASPPNRTSSSHRCQRSVPSVMPGYSACLAVPEVAGGLPAGPSQGVRAGRSAAGGDPGIHAGPGAAAAAAVDGQRDGDQADGYDEPQQQAGPVQVRRLAEHARAPRMTRTAGPTGLRAAGATRFAAAADLLVPGYLLVP